MAFEGIPVKKKRLYLTGFILMGAHRFELWTSCV